VIFSSNLPHQRTMPSQNISAFTKYSDMCKSHSPYFVTHYSLHTFIPISDSGIYSASERLIEKELKNAASFYTAKEVHLPVGAIYCTGARGHWIFF
jgi:hypothetical protein